MKNSLLILFAFILLVPFNILAQWSTPVNISPNAIKASMNENMGPCIALSHDTIHVIWSDRRAHGYAIYYTRSVDTGHTWSNAVPITDTTGKASMPSIAVNGRNVHIVWWDSLNEVTNFPTSGNSSFYMHSLDGGNTWGTKVCIDSSTVFWPGVAVHGSTVLVSLNKGAFGATIICLTKSIDNGVTFGAEQQVSTRVGTGRSEDQATATDGRYIYMSWNDNRNGPMEIYYRRSKDMGLTWDPEVALTSSDSYTTMVCLDSEHVDVPHGAKSTYFNSWIRQSSDSGNTWKADEQVTTNNNASYDELYPFMVREGLNLHMVSVNIGGWGEWYSYSADGGATWVPQVLLGTGHSSSFIALTCPALHVVWPDNGIIYYMRNPTGNPTCGDIFSGIGNTEHSNPEISISPNPVHSSATIMFGEQGVHIIEIYDVTGRRLSGFTSICKETTFSCEELPAGMYFVRTMSGNSTQMLKFIKQ